MNHVRPSTFRLPDANSAKNSSTLIGADDQHFAEIAYSLRDSVAQLTARLDSERRRPDGAGQAAMERDIEVHSVTARLRALRRYGVDICLGRIDVALDGAPESSLYIGRLGLISADGKQLLVDWRSPSAAPFFEATHAEPMGIVRRRRYRWREQLVVDYWDEVLTTDALDEMDESQRAALDDHSAFVASLGASRSGRMHDVLTTIAADQHAIIRAPSSGALVVDGGPGTGKTVVALHRTAHLIFADRRLAPGRGGVLFVGPHRPYLRYVADVLPRLGVDGASMCTLGDLAPVGADVPDETDPVVAQLKSIREMVAAVDRAVAFYEEPPNTRLTVSTPWDDVVVRSGDWATAFGAVEPGTPHNEARERIRDELVEIVCRRHDSTAPLELVRRATRDSPELNRALARAWPMLDAHEIVGDLWTVPAYLRLSAPQLTPEQIRMLQRDDPAAWTASDLPILDAARRRLGDRSAAAREHRRRQRAEAQRGRRQQVVDDLVAADDDGEGLVTMLRKADIREVLIDDEEREPDTDHLAGPFAHVVVDEAQELTDAQWHMVLSRCPSRSLTVVGDRAQARNPFTESWSERLERVGVTNSSTASLSVNYRTPAEIMATAEPVIRAALPDANVPTSVRSTGVPVTFADVADRDRVIDEWLTASSEGTACVIGDATFRDTSRVRSSTPQMCKGLEFDLVVLVEPHRFGDDLTGAVDRYVAMTRATQRLVVLGT